jgi:hypothetical protein
MQWNIRSASLSVKIHTEGPLAFLGHDRSFNVPLAIRLERAPEGESAALDGLQVHAEGDVKGADIEGEITDRDRKEIVRRKDKDVLETHRFPICQYTGRLDTGSKILDGSLTLHGQTKPLQLPVSVKKAGDGWIGEGQIELDLTPFGIKPFKAFVGALRVNPKVTVYYRVEAKAV